MLFCKIIINGTQYGVSNEYGESATGMWEAYIRSIGSISIEPQYEYGGRVLTTYGTIDFIPPMFDFDWPPPDTVTIWLGTGMDEASSVGISIATYVLKSFDRNGVQYTALGNGYGNTDDSSVFNDTLINVFSTFATTLGLTLNSTHARSPSPNVVYTNTTEQLLIDMMSECAAGFAHYFYFTSTEVVLVDMLGYPGTHDITEFDFTPASYTGPNAISLFKSGDFSIPGSISEGSELSVTIWHDTKENVQAALGNIKIIMERPVMHFELPDTDEPHTYGAKVIFSDDSTIHPTNGWFINTKKVLYFEDKTEKIVLAGRGEFT